MSNKHWSFEANHQEFVPKSVARSSLAFLPYTFGSTGTPKGVMVAHSNIIHNQQLIHQTLGHSEQSIGVGWLPLFHDMGLIGHVSQSIYVGFPSILMPLGAFLQKDITIKPVLVAKIGGGMRSLLLVCPVPRR